MKYIPADKLIAEVERRKEKWLAESRFIRKGKDKAMYAAGKSSGYTEFLSLIDSLQQEQPEIDLEKFIEKIKTFQEKYKHPEIVSIKGAMAFMARMFYQYPNVARLWYEQLPKATMD